MISLIAGAFAGAATFFGSMFGLHVPFLHQEAGSTTPPQMHASSTEEHAGMMWRNGSSSPMMPTVVGKVSAVDGTTLTILGHEGRDTATTTYSVDASDTKVLKAGVGTTTVSSIKSGDMVAVLGILSGSSVSAKLILDGLTMPQLGMRMGSSTPMMRHGSSTMEMHGGSHESWGGPKGPHPTSNAPKAPAQ